MHILKHSALLDGTFGAQLLVSGQNFPLVRLGSLGRLLCFGFQLFQAFHNLVQGTQQGCLLMLYGHKYGLSGWLRLQAIRLGFGCR